MYRNGDSLSRDGIEAALTEVGRVRETPAGFVRLIAPSTAVAMTLGPKLAESARDYPDVVLDVTTEDDRRRDLVAGRFDAGIHLGESLPRDMVAVKVTGERLSRGKSTRPGTSRAAGPCGCSRTGVRRSTASSST